MNTRSLQGKTIELSSVTSNADIVCITETHIDDTIKDHHIFDYNSKLIYANDRNISGGRVLIAVDHKFPTSEVTFNNPDNTELIFVLVKRWLLAATTDPSTTDVSTLSHMPLKRSVENIHLIIQFL